MSPLRAALADYLALRRALGYKLEEPAKALEEFVTYLEGHDLDHITAGVALDWSMWSGAPRADAARRLSSIRLFARHLAALDGRTEVPPGRLLPRRVERKPPYLFSDVEIQALMAAAASLEEPFRALTMQTLVGLLACTGLRPMEACNLSPADVDLDDALLVVRDSKAGASRLVPLERSAVAVLERYEDARQAVFGHCVCDPPGLFMWSASRRFTMARATATFRRLLAKTGIAAPPGQRPPRLYDLRHRFAVTTLVTWYRQGVDVGRALPALSTYMGHLKPKDTYWYLQAVPELLGAAALRLEAYLGEQP